MPSQLVELETRQRVMHLMRNSEDLDTTILLKSSVEDM
jgi:hypothetical protein